MSRNMTDAERKELIEGWIVEIEALMNDDDYQMDFFNSLCDHWKKKGWFSPKQMEAFERIYERVTR